ncbi:uncharacterized protein BDV17DRAFT_54590 [Aspergillus undulatus]|uniref:uncharacterized protein n=1 Tax=Aspergillus undulatus TaxID=1810928 RepID=UPI003CCCBCDA
MVCSWVFFAASFALSHLRFSCWLQTPFLLSFDILSIYRWRQHKCNHGVFLYITLFKMSDASTQIMRHSTDVLLDGPAPLGRSRPRPECHGTSTRPKSTFQSSLQDQSKTLEQAADAPRARMMVARAVVYLLRSTGCRKSPRTR